METIDCINTKWGRGTVHSASQGVMQEWKMRQSMKSPRYTTCINEIPATGRNWFFPKNYLFK